MERGRIMESLNSIQLDSPNVVSLSGDDSTVPEVAKNIKRFSDLYKNFLGEEIREDIEIDTQQAEKVRRLQDNNQFSDITPDKKH